ncbi:hypothetical protein EXS70_04520 [Candidatus Peribacteria bacterium]|nr:hypothetical protein [Candidatus Peribacteria bacterium]
MHIQNLTSGRSHRHFLAAPLFALLVAVTAFVSFGSAQANVLRDAAPTEDIRAVGGDTAFTFDAGIAGILREDAILRDSDELRLEEGTAMFSSDGLMRVHVGNVVLSAFHGGFLVARTGDKFSVHALTSPVVLTHGSFRLAIPAGMQGTFAQELPSLAALADIVAEQGRLEAIPGDLLRDELRELQTIPINALPAFHSETVLSPLFLPFALPAAQERSEENAGTARLSSLYRALSAGDAESAHALLRSEDMRALLSAPTLPTGTLPALLSVAAGIPSAAQEIIPSVTDPDFWFLLAIHPLYRSAAWEAGGSPAMPQSVHIQRWLQFPPSDIGDAVPPRAVSRWQEEIQKYLTLSDHPEVFLELLLKALDPYRTFAEASDYPERLQRYATALQSLIEPHEHDLTPAGQALYARWKTVDDIAPYVDAAPLPQAQPSPDVEIIPKVAQPFDAKALEQTTKQLLLSVGALYTVETALHAEAADTVTVKGILFASTLGEHRYDFTINPASKQLNNITQDGQSLPYALTLEAFGKWASGGR